MDLVAIVIVYSMITYGETGAVIFAFGQGLIIDIFSGGLFGLFALIYLIVFFGIKLGSSPFDLFAVRGRMLVIFLAVFLKGILLISFLYVFDYQFLLTTSVLLEIAASAVFSGMVAPFLLYLFDHLDHVLGGAEKEA